MTNEKKDEILWKTAQKRAAFKYHVLIYFIMNVFFWTIYYISLRTNTTPPQDRDMIPWPVYPMLGWGIGVLFNYVDVYKSRNSLAEKEYEKLKNKNL
jgi:hypothetical protein